MKRIHMSNDETRCCGTGTCIINSAGECWCGQRWDGKKMCFPVANVQDRDPSKINVDEMASDASGSGSNLDGPQ
jgi:hypothetical protein